MTFVWDFYWPALVAAAIIGVMAGVAHFRRSAGGGQYRWVLRGVALALGISLLWHGPIGAADRFAATVEQSARTTLHDFEMDQVTASLPRGPLSRTMFLSGPADEFQRMELMRIMGAVPGVAKARWDRPAVMPLFVEIMILTLAAFALGGALSYLLELHRRANANWSW